MEKDNGNENNESKNNEDKDAKNNIISIDDQYNIIKGNNMRNKKINQKLLDQFNFT